MSKSMYLLSMGFVLAAACGDDGTGETMAGSSGGEGSTSVAETSSSSSGEPGTSSGGAESSTSGEGTTMAVDGTSSGGDSSTGEVPEVFFPEVLAIIQANCSCHRTMMPSGSLDMHDDVAYDSLVNVPAVEAPTVSYVTPFDADNSYMLLKLLGDQATVGGTGTRMPQGGAALPDDQIQLVRNWILSGAQP